MKKILTVIGTRPEIIKMSSLIPLFDKNFHHILIHTDQHYSFNMDKVFFKELGIRNPDYFLGVGSGTPATQVGEILTKLEPFILKEKPDAIIVYGDTNSTLGGALTAAKNNVPVVHIEAGGRSFDRTMPEEINRVIIDNIASLHFAYDHKAISDLKNEGISGANVILSGWSNYSVLLNHVKKRNKKDLEKNGLTPKKYLLATIHRAANTEKKSLSELITALNLIAEKIKVVFPQHPRTQKIIDKNNLHINPKILTLPPQGFFEFINLMANALFILTDSGGVQEEAAMLNIPVLAMRNENELYELINAGKIKVISNNKEKIIKEAKFLIDHPEQIQKIASKPYPWITNTNEIIIDQLKRFLNAKT